MAQTSSRTSEAAQRYAAALFDLAKIDGSLTDIQSIFADFAKVIATSKELSTLMGSPLYDRGDKAQALDALADKIGLPALFRRFLGVVSINGRAVDIPAIQVAFDTLYIKDQGVQRAIARTAKPMDAEQRVRIENILTKAVGGKVDLTTEVDEDLIGGIQLRIGSTLIDASLKAKLERLNTAMKGA